MIMTHKGLNSYFNITSTYNKKTSANILNSLVNIICFIRVEVKAFCILYNII